MQQRLPFSCLLILVTLSFVLSVQAADPKGFLDAATCDAFSGWSCDPDNYSQALQVHFYVDGPAGSGTFAGSMTANSTRESAVGEQCGGYSNRGFSLGTPSALKDGLNHSIYAYGINIPNGGNPQLPSTKSFCCPASQELSIGNAKIKLVFNTSCSGVLGYSIYANNGTGWYKTGEVTPFSRIKVAGGSAFDIYPAGYHVLRDDNTSKELEFHAQSGNMRFTFFFRLHGGESVVYTSYRMNTTSQVSLELFQGPTILAGEGSFGAEKNFSVFGGLDFIAGDEESSVLSYNAHPLKVTLPYMVVGYRKYSIGLIWDPLQKWDGNNSLLQTRYVSPDWAGNRSNHVMGLLLPTVWGGWFDESPGIDERNKTLKYSIDHSAYDYASTPYVLAAGKELSMASYIYSGYSDDPNAILKEYFRLFNLPNYPAMPVTYDEAIQNSYASYLNTSYNKSGTCWINWPGGACGRDTHVGALLWQYYLWKTDNASKSKAKELLLEVFNSSSFQRGGTDMPFYFGYPESALENIKNSAYSRISNQRGDGSWNYSGNPFLGDLNDTSLGTNSVNAESIMYCAKVLYDQKCLMAGLKALAYMERFEKPEGSQTWEVPLHYAELVSAAQSINAYTYAYEITGEQKYLDKAIEWAYKGLPFMYMYSIPERSIMSYASIPVFGGSYYTYYWQGQPVQWNGLEYSKAIYALGGYDDSFPWRTVAEGITISGLQQQDLDRVKSVQPGHYPDWFQMIGNHSGGVLIQPSLILDNVILNTDKSRLTTTILVNGSHRAHITVSGRITRAVLNATDLALDLDFPSGESDSVAVAGLPAAINVIKNGIAISVYAIIGCPQAGCAIVDTGCAGSICFHVNVSANQTLGMNSEAVDVLGGKNYSVSYSVKGLSANQSAYAAIIWGRWDQGGAELSRDVKYLPPTGKYETVVINASSPAQATQAILALRVNTEGTQMAETEFYLDQINISQGVSADIVISADPYREGWKHSGNISYIRVTHDSPVLVVLKYAMTSTTTTTTTTSTSTTSTTIPCAMPGNYPSCGDVTLYEVVSAINQWAVGSFDLGDVIDLINSWADPANHPPG
jgi:hypothetical protein